MARRSALAGRSVITPNPEPSQPEESPQEPQNASQEAAEPAPAPPAPAEASKPAEERTAAPKGKKKKVSFYQLPEEEARAKAAWMHTMGHTGHRTITSFMEAAVASYTRELEAKYNDARPFE